MHSTGIRQTLRFVLFHDATTYLTPLIFPPKENCSDVSTFDQVLRRLLCVLPKPLQEATASFIGNRNTCTQCDFFLRFAGVGGVDLPDSVT